MTWLGAGGDTASAMKDTLGYGTLSDDEVKQAYRHLIDALTTLDPLVTMEIANSIWTRLGFTVEEAFLDDNETYFDAQCSELDFSDDGAADTINAWVDEQTHGKIDGIVEPPISAETVMFLINAVYFNGSWTTEFDPEQTQSGTFHGLGGDTEVPMMRDHREDFRYLETEQFQAVDLPYGNGAFSMTVFLPKTAPDASDFVASLTPETFAGYLAQMSADEGMLIMPRFEVEFEESLNDVLTALGMGVAFDSSAADFSGINPDADLFISKVKHKSWVQVDEVGTEAAAVTSVEIGVTSVPMYWTMTVDRPFVFVIHEQATDALLFVGKVVNL
jgi:serine protease inhibitor